MDHFTYELYALLNVCYSAVVIIFRDKYNKSKKWRFLGHAIEKMPKSWTNYNKIGPIMGWNELVTLNIRYE